MIQSIPAGVWRDGIAPLDCLITTQLFGHQSGECFFRNTPPDCRSRSCRPGLPHQWPFRPDLSIRTRRKRGLAEREETPRFGHHVYHALFIMFLFLILFFLNHVFSPIFFPDHHLKFSIDLPRDAISAGMLCWSGGTGWKPISGSLGRPTGVGRWLQSVGISYAYFKDKPGINQNL